MQNSTVSGSAAGTSGGGLHAASGAAVAFTGGALLNNSASARGGGAFLASPRALLWGTALRGNSALRSGGGLYADTDFAASCAAASAAAALLLPPGASAASVFAGAPRPPPLSSSNATTRTPLGVGAGCPAGPAAPAPFVALTFSLCVAFPSALRFSRQPGSCAKQQLTLTPLVRRNSAPPDTGADVFWVRRSSPAVPFPCPACAFAAGGAGSVSTEPIALSFAATPSRLADADEGGLPSFLLSEFTVELKDWSGGRAADSLDFLCTATLLSSSAEGGGVSSLAPAPPPRPAGFPPPLPSPSSPTPLVGSGTAHANASALQPPPLAPPAAAGGGDSDTVLLLGAAGVAAQRGLARFSGVRVLNGTIGRSYPLSVACSDGSAAAPLALSPASAFAVTLAPCPAGKQALAGRACEPCKAGTFNLEAGGQCRACPFGALCPGWDPALRATPLEARADWWRSGNASSAFFLCPLGTGGSVCRPGPHSGDAACADGYRGPLCAVCADGFYMWGKRCRRCDPAARVVLPLAAALGAALLLLLLLWAPVDVSNPDSTVRLKIATSLLQALGLIKDYAIDWRGGLLSALLSYSDVLNIGLEVTAPRCSAPSVSFFSTYLAALAAPFAACGLCLALLCANLALSYLRGRRGGGGGAGGGRGASCGSGTSDDALAPEEEQQRQRSASGGGGRQDSSPPRAATVAAREELTPGDAVLGWLLPPWLDPRRRGRRSNAGSIAGGHSGSEPTSPVRQPAGAPPAEVAQKSPRDAAAPGPPPSPVASPKSPLLPSMSPARLAGRRTGASPDPALCALPEEGDDAETPSGREGPDCCGSPRRLKDAARLDGGATPPCTPPQPAGGCGGSWARAIDPSPERAEVIRAADGVRSVADIALEVDLEAAGGEGGAACSTAQPASSARAIARQLFFSDPAGAFRGASGGGTTAGGVGPDAACAKPYSDSVSSCPAGHRHAQQPEPSSPARGTLWRWLRRGRSDDLSERSSSAPFALRPRGRAASSSDASSFAACLPRKRRRGTGSTGSGSDAVLLGSAAGSSSSSAANNAAGGVARPFSGAGSAASIPPLPPPAAPAPDLRTRFLKNCFWLLLLLYSGVSQKALQLYGTRTTDTGAFLRADYSVRTRDASFAPDPRYSAFARAGAAPAVLFPLGLPLLFALAIRRERAAGRLGLGRCSFIAFATAGYREGWQFWECAEMLRKLLLAAIGVFAWDGAVNTGGAPVQSQGLTAPVLQPLLGQAVTVLHLGALAWARPYARREHNALAAAALLLTWLPLLVGGSVLSPLLKELSQLSGSADGGGGGDGSSSSSHSSSIAAESQRAAVATALGAFLIATVGPLVAVAVASEARQAIRMAMRTLPTVASTAAEAAGRASESVRRAADSVAGAGRQASRRLSTFVAAASSPSSAAGRGGGLRAATPASTPERGARNSPALARAGSSPAAWRPPLSRAGSGEVGSFVGSPAAAGAPLASVGASIGPLRSLFRSHSSSLSGRALFGGAGDGQAALRSPTAAGDRDAEGRSALRSPTAAGRSGGPGSLRSESPAPRSISMRWAALMMEAEAASSASVASPPRAAPGSPPLPPLRAHSSSGGIGLERAGGQQQLPSLASSPPQSKVPAGCGELPPGGCGAASSSSAADEGRSVAYNEAAAGQPSVVHAAGVVVPKQPLAWSVSSSASPAPATAGARYSLALAAYLDRQESAGRRA